MSHDDEKVKLTIGDLHTMLREAARKGATDALEDLGLSDFSKADFIEMQGLLGVWKDAKQTFFRTFIRAIAVATLAALALGVGYQFKST